MSADQQSSVGPVLEPVLLEVFRRGREIYSDLFIAGGYLRDREIGVFPNDVDFFTFQPLREDRQKYETQWDSADFGLVEKRLTAVEEFDVIDFTTEHSLGAVFNTQIIHINPEYASYPEAVIERFLFGAQMIMWTPEMGYRRSQLYHYDIDRKQFTVRRNDHTFDEQSVALKWFGSATKSGLQDRFPDWSLVIPHQFWTETFAAQMKNPGVEEEDCIRFLSDRRKRPSE